MRDEILKYLSNVRESTAKAIAAGSGHAQLDVARELNRMHAEGLVEREKRAGGGNEYMYWLATAPRAAVAPPSATSPASTPAIPPVQPTVDPVVVEELLAELANERSTSTRLRGEAESLRVELNAEKVLSVSLNAQFKNQNEQIDALKLQLEQAEGANQRLKANNASLEQQLDELTIGPVGAKGPTFFTIGRDCDPKRHSSIENARKRASALVRSERESEVLVCTPVGRVVRGVEWVAK